MLKSKDFQQVNRSCQESKICNIDLEKHLYRIGIAYEASTFTDGIRPQHEEYIKKFEANYASIAAEYRWLLFNLGGCYLIELWIFDLKELEVNYTYFYEAYEEYMRECETRLGVSSEAQVMEAQYLQTQKAVKCEDITMTMLTLRKLWRTFRNLFQIQQNRQKVFLDTIYSIGSIY